MMQRTGVVVVATQVRSANLKSVYISSSSSFSSFHSHLQSSGFASIPKPRHGWSELGLGFSNLDDALTSFNRLAGMRPLPSVEKFNQILSTIAENKHYSTVLSLIHQLDLFGSRPLVNPDIYSFNIAINCYCLLGKVNFGFSVLAKVFKLGFEPNCVTLTTLIKGLYAHDGKLPHAMELVQKTVEHKLHPNAKNLGKLIDGIHKSGDTSAAISLSRKTKEFMSGRHEIVNYSTFIGSLSNHRHVNEALRLFSDMVQDGITFSCLIHGLCSLGRSYEASRLFKEILEMNVSPDVRTFTMTIDALCHEGKAREAHRVLELMVQKGHEPDNMTYNALLDGYYRRGEVENAIDVIHIMTSKGHEPDYLNCWMTYMRGKPSSD